jgi:hypothetical protein
VGAGPGLVEAMSQAYAMPAGARRRWCITGGGCLSGALGEGKRVQQRAQLARHCTPTPFLLPGPNQPQSTCVSNPDCVTTRMGQKRAWELGLSNLCALKCLAPALLRLHLHLQLPAPGPSPLHCVSVRSSFLLSRLLN